MRQRIRRRMTRRLPGHLRSSRLGILQSQSSHETQSRPALRQVSAGEAVRVSESEDSLNSSTWSCESGTGTWWASLGRFYVSTGKWTRDSDADVASWRQVLKCFLNLHLQAHGGQAPVVSPAPAPATPVPAGSEVCLCCQGSGFVTRAVNMRLF